MGPEYWKPQSPTRLKKCSERRTDSCDLNQTDGCCAVIACSYCLEWERYDQPTSDYGQADWDGTGWSGTIAGATFRAFWERGYESGECEFVVLLNDVEVYRNDCYGGQSCRDSSDSANATIDYEDGVLTWIKKLYRPLEYVIDPDTGCRTWYCGECECTCECLCVSVTDPEGNVLAGELCDVSYSCDGPLWEGRIGYYEISLALMRDIYGDCVVVATIDGDEQDAVPIDSCTDFSGTIETYDGTVIEFRCKQCGCVGEDGCPCCPNWPLGASASIRWTSANTAANDCTSDTDPQEVTGDFGCPNPIESETIIFIIDTPLRVRLYCDELTGSWKIEYKSAATSPWPGPGLGDESTWEWVEVDFDIQCPDCNQAIDGIATGAIDFTALMRCETSGGFVDYEVLVHGDIEVLCP